MILNIRLCNQQKKLERNCFTHSFLCYFQPSAESKVKPELWTEAGNSVVSCAMKNPPQGHLFSTTVPQNPVNVLVSKTEQIICHCGPT
jgi:hypothetical protein